MKEEAGRKQLTERSQKIARLELRKVEPGLRNPVMKATEKIAKSTCTPPITQEKGRNALCWEVKCSTVTEREGGFGGRHVSAMPGKRRLRVRSLEARGQHYRMAFPLCHNIPQ